MSRRSVDARTQSELTDYLVRRGLLKTPELIKIFRRVDRGWFLPAQEQPFAYIDSPQGIGHNVTISAPHMHAMMAELLVQRGPLYGKRILDVGSGSGYLTFVLGLLALPDRNAIPRSPTPSDYSGSDSDASSAAVPAPKVFGVEHVRDLVQSSNMVLRTYLPELQPVVRILEGDGRSLTANNTADFGQQPLSKRVLNKGFDLIHVGAACGEFPENLAALLNRGGRMVVPVGPRGHQELLVVDKDDGGHISTTKDCGVMFVPLTGLQNQIGTRW